MSNLPQELTLFVGREREIEEAARLLADSRLLTLTGTGGTGKTRLALRLAAQVSGDYRDGVWLVELAALTDATLVPQAVASALGAREEGGRPLADTLVAFLKDKQLLLVLDNCEHLLGACSQLVGTLLRACPQLRVLATSREALGVEGECTYAVPPLQIPGSEYRAPSSGGTQPELAQLERFESVRLFVERARLRRTGFVLTPQNAEAVARLCYHLDGIPLAIELAAARVGLMTPEQIVSRLDERFRLLRSANTDALPRQQTLGALMDWSYDLLTEEEQAIFRWLSVFAGGFSLEMAYALCGGVAGLEEYAFIDLLSRLVDKSLVVSETIGNEARYGMLETVRGYAFEKLEESEASMLRDGHAGLFLRFAEVSEDELLTERQAEWLSRLEGEHDNLRAALAWYRHEEPGGDRELRLAGAVVWFWYFRGYVSEGRTQLETTLANALPDDHHSLARAKVLSAAGVMSYLQSDYAAARSRLEDGLQIWEEHGDKRGTAFTLAFLGRVLNRQGERSAISLLERSADLFRDVSERWGLALALDFLGTALLGASWSAEDDKRVAALHEESIALYRELGHAWGVALELSNFGRVAFRAGDMEAARARLDEALLIQREVGDKWMLAWTLLNRGDVARTESDLALADRMYGEAESLFRAIGDWSGTAKSLYSLSLVARSNGDDERAAQLYNESLTLFREMGDAQSVEDVLTALQDTPEASSQKPAAVQTTYPYELTAREVEVLRLLAEGHTDAQIAERLVLSTRTVQAHLRSVYSKLGINTRSAATRMAMEMGLGNA